MKKRITLFLVIAAIIAGLSIAGTVSLLKAQDGDINTFTVGPVKIILDEADVDEFGQIIEGAARVKENKYHLMPGYTYTKDPTITVEAGSMEAYIRLIVTLNKSKELKEILGEDYKLEDYITGWNSEIWKCTNIIENEDNTTTYEFRYYKTVDGINDKNEKKQVILEPLFESFEIPGTLNGDELSKISDLEIKVIGHAMQAKGFENENIAWESFEKEMN